MYRDLTTIGTTNSLGDGPAQGLALARLGGIDAVLQIALLNDRDEGWRLVADAVMTSLHEARVILVTVARRPSKEGSQQ